MKLIILILLSVSIINSNDTFSNESKLVDRSSQELNDAASNQRKLVHKYSEDLIKNFGTDFKEASFKKNVIEIFNFAVQVAKTDEEKERILSKIVKNFISFFNPFLLKRKLHKLYYKLHSGFPKGIIYTYLTLEVIEKITALSLSFYLAGKAGFVAAPFLSFFLHHEYLTLPLYFGSTYLKRKINAWKLANPNKLFGDRRLYNQLLKAKDELFKGLVPEKLEVFKFETDDRPIYIQFVRSKDKYSSQIDDLIQIKSNELKKIVNDPTFYKYVKKLSKNRPYLQNYMLLNKIFSNPIYKIQFQQMLTINNIDFTPLKSFKHEAALFLNDDNKNYQELIKLKLQFFALKKTVKRNINDLIDQHFIEKVSDFNKKRLLYQHSLKNLIDNHQREILELEFKLLNQKSLKSELINIKSKQQELVSLILKVNTLNQQGPKCEDYLLQIAN